MNPLISSLLPSALPGRGLEPRSRGEFRLLGALFVFLGLVLPTLSPAQEIQVAPEGVNLPGAVDLIAAVKTAPPGAVIGLSPGTYELIPEAYLDSSCGNCEDPSMPIPATAGLVVRGEGIKLVGSSQGEVIIRTHAGYGIVFEDCTDCLLTRVTITAGERDSLAEATNAAVVVKNSSVEIVDCVIRDNIGSPDLVRANVVGIAGIAGREGAEMEIRNNRIIRNSWDGIALYRGARAVIEDNIIDGVDLARGDEVGGGRGVGIGATWDADAVIRGNLVRRYWKGIGGFVDAQITVEENVVEHIATWGMTLWDAGEGRPSGFFLRNVVFDTGACGVSIVRDNAGLPFPGRLVQNVIVQTGQDSRYDSGEPYCYQLPIAEHAVPPKFTISDNVFYRNRTQGGQPAAADYPETGFRYRLQKAIVWLGDWKAPRESDFYKDFSSLPEPVTATDPVEEPEEN